MRDMVDVDPPAQAPLCRPTARARRALLWAQVGLGLLVVGAAVAVGGAVQDRIDDRAERRPDPVLVTPTHVLPEAVPAPPLPGVTDSAVPTHAAPAGDARAGLVRAEPSLARGTAAPAADDHDDVTPSGEEGSLAALGTLVVGWTLTAAGGTVGRRRLEQREHDRWAADWYAVEPEWSGRVR